MYSKKKITPTFLGAISSTSRYTMSRFGLSHFRSVSYDVYKMKPSSVNFRWFIYGYCCYFTLHATKCRSREWKSYLRTDVCVESNPKYFSLKSSNKNETAVVESFVSKYPNALFHFLITKSTLTLTLTLH